jgi:hypothetical protein
MELKLFSFFSIGSKLGWMVKATPRQLYRRERDPISTVQEAGLAPGLVGMGADNLASTGNRPSNRPASSESLCRLSHTEPLQKAAYNIYMVLLLRSGSLYKPITNLLVLIFNFRRVRKIAKSNY